MDVMKKALFYHLAVDHRVVTADFEADDWEPLHSELHNLMHSFERQPERQEARPLPQEDA